MSSDFVMAQYEKKIKAMNLLPFKLGYLPDFAVTKAKEELGETEETKAKAVKELRSLVEQETSLVCPRDDHYMLQYLRAGKFNIKRAFKLVQDYYGVKKSYKDVYSNCDLEMLRKLFATGVSYLLPYRDTNGCVIFVINMRKWDPDVFTFGQVILGMTLNFLLSVEEPATQICGIRVLFDTKGTSLKHVRGVTPRMLSLFSRALRNCLPIRLKSIHIYNENVLFQYLWRLVKIFLSSKMINRFQFHGPNTKQIHDIIPKIILPAQTDGDYPLDPCDWFNTEIEQYYERAVELLSYGYRN